jgi:pimeloyl-[acyl-carrier protein] methyl ester esterase
VKKDIVLISGWSFKANVLAPLSAQLQPTFRVHMLSLRDLDPVVSAEEPLTGYRDGLLDFLASFDTPPIVAGWSMGGMIAIEAAIHQPEAIAALVLLSSTARFCRADDRPWATPPAALRTMKAGTRRHPEDVLDGFLQASESPADELLSAHPEWTFPDPVLLCHGLDYLEQVDLREAKPNCPTLILHGTQDAIISHRAATKLMEQFDDVHLTLFDDAGHGLPIQKSQAVAQEMITTFGS